MNGSGVGGAVGSAIGPAASTQPTKGAGSGGPPASASEGSSAGSSQPQPNSSGTVGENPQSGSGSPKAVTGADNAPTSGPGAPWAQWGQSSSPLNNAPGATGSTASSSLGRTVLTGGLPYAPGGTMAGVNNQIGDYQSMQRRYAQSYSQMLGDLAKQSGGLVTGQKVV